MNPNNDKYAVYAILFELDSSLKNDVFDLFNFSISGKQKTIPFPVKFNTNEVYHYVGSLTTPKCS